MGVTLALTQDLVLKARRKLDHPWFALVRFEIIGPGGVRCVSLVEEEREEGEDEHIYI